MFYVVISGMMEGTRVSEKKLLTFDKQTDNISHTRICPSRIQT